MLIEGPEEIFNTVFIAKKLYDMGKYEIVKDSFFDTVCYDNYYENIFYLIENLFEKHYCRYSDRRCLEYHVMSDPVIEELYALAKEYGKRHNLSDKDNPYISGAEWQVCSALNFSYCVSCRLIGYTEPKLRHKSRLAVFLYQDDWIDMGRLVYGLIEIYEWFSDSCSELKKLLADDARERRTYDRSCNQNKRRRENHR